ncbi:hypothetical protein [Lysinibacillus sp. NPDC093216]|uniref:hypothetical protein n=1 Tax=Lysinibacillus sp. NPDC093216 TaxID=3390576 RepID=UPI003CFC1006
MVDVPEFWEYGEETGVLLFTLSTSFVAAFLFYLLDIWLPNKEKQDILKLRLSKPLNKILLNMIAPLIGLLILSPKSNITISKIVSLSKEDLEELLSEIDLFNDRNSKYFFDDWRDDKVIEYLLSFLANCNRLVDQVNILPNVDFDLLMILDKIKYSDYNEALEEQRYFYSLSVDEGGGVSGIVLTEGILEYVQLFEELKKYMIDNDIEITFDKIPIIEYMME